MNWSNVCFRKYLIWDITKNMQLKPHFNYTLSIHSSLTSSGEGRKSSSSDMETSSRKQTVKHAKDQRKCTNQIHELVMTEINSCIAARLVESVQVLKESYIGTLRRCLHSLEDQPDSCPTTTNTSDTTISTSDTTNSTPSNQRFVIASFFKSITKYWSNVLFWNSNCWKWY